MTIVQQALEAGARLEKACQVVGISTRTFQRWRGQGTEDQRAGPKSPPANKLTKAERAAVFETINSVEFREQSPKTIVPTLADRGVYLASESTIYRLLRNKGQATRRGPKRSPSAKKPRELRALGPNQVWTWDITYLPTVVSGRFFYLYLFLDLFSRKIVGWEVHEKESQELSSELFKRICTKEKPAITGLTLHSDNGGPMKGATMRATLERLGVAVSFNRPGVSNDNPYSESLFSTLKYRPWYPKDRFGSLEEARTWVRKFVYWYNKVHLHSGIKYVTPEARHAGEDKDLLAKRREVYEEAKQRNPGRWSGQTRNWDWVKEVVLNADPPISQKSQIAQL